MNRFTTWLAGNMFVAAAFVFPLIIAGLFLLAQTLPNSLVDAPEHDVIFSLTDHQKQLPYEVSIAVRDGALVAVLSQRLTSTHSVARYPLQTLYRYESDSGAIHKLPLDLPEQVTRPYHDRLAVFEQSRSPVEDAATRPVNQDENQYYESSYPLEISGINDLVTRLNPQPVASDGYEFRSGNYRRRVGIFGEIFGMRGSIATASLHRSGRVIEIPRPHEMGHGNYRNAIFVAWAEDVGANRESTNE